MRLRDQVALTLPTFFLRLILGITFLWAGTGKLMGTYSVTGNDAARLANIGVMPTEATPAPPAPPAPEITPGPTTAPEPEPISEPINPLPGSEPAEPELDDQANEIIEMIEEQLADPSEQPTELPTELPTEQPVEQQQYELHSIQYNGTHYAASDFPDDMEVKQVYSIALMILKAADPGLTEDSTPINPILPAKLASSPWPKALAWAVAVTEIAAGAFLILGFLTRISALGTLSVMLVALWMTQFGPAAIQSTDAILGFIPSKSNPWAPGAYSDLFWQLALTAMSGSVFLMGSGALGIDRLIFKPARRDPYLHGDPKAGKPKKDAPVQASADRGAFDRTPNPTP